jgi:hypothetical protein
MISDDPIAWAGHAPNPAIPSVPLRSTPELSDHTPAIGAQVRRRIPWPCSNPIPIHQPRGGWRDRPCQTDGGCDPPLSAPSLTQYPGTCASHPVGDQAGPGHPLPLGHPPAGLPPSEPSKISWATRRSNQEQAARAARPSLNDRTSPRTLFHAFLLVRASMAV